MTILPWPLVDSKGVLDLGLLRVSRDRARSPRTGQERDFHVIHMVDWLMVVAVTARSELVMVRQYRHGSREASLEVPGGLHDAAAAEAEQRGAARELAEETGFGGGVWRRLGVLRPQPALFSNRAWVFLAQNVEAIAEPELDQGEDIEVVLVPGEDVARRAANGEIDNAMTLAALALATMAGYVKGRQS